MHVGWARFFARMILGLMFFMIGVFKVFDLGPLEHARNLFVGRYADTFLPVWSLWLTGTLIPFVELIAGGLLIVGFRVRVAAIALGFDLTIVTFGHLLAEPFFDLSVHVIPRVLLLIAVLVMPDEDDQLSVDAWLKKRKADVEA